MLSFVWKRKKNLDCELLAMREEFHSNEKEKEINAFWNAFFFPQRVAQRSTITELGSHLLKETELLHGLLEPVRRTNTDCFF